MTTILRLSLVALILAASLGGCYYGPAPGYGYYAPGYGYYAPGYYPGYYYGPTVSGTVIYRGGR